MFSKFLLILFASLSLMANEKKLISSYELKPHIVFNLNHHVSGKVIDSFNCASKNVFANYVFKEYPRKRAIYNVIGSEANRDFIALLPFFQYDLKYRDQLSHPLGVEKWYLVSKTKIEKMDLSKIKEEIGVLSGSLMDIFLTEEPNNSSFRTNNYESLIKSFLANRVNFLLLSEYDLNRNPKLRENNFSYFARYNQIRALFAKHIPKNKISAFNEKLDQCATSIINLDDSERQKIIQFAQKIGKQIKSSEEYKLEIAKHRNFKAADLHKNEENWQKDNVLSDKILKTKLSKLLKGFETRLINEIFIFGKHGQLMASNFRTSDYNQADEEKYLQVYKQSKDFYISPIHYDQSTNSFQSQITLPLKGLKDTDSMLTIGINIENFFRANSQSHSP